MTLSDLLAASAERWADRPLLIGDSGSVSYGEFQRRVHGLACALAECGLAAGERAAVILPSGEEMLYLWFALARLGSVMVPVNPALAELEVATLLRHLEVGALVADSRRLRAHGRPIPPALRLAGGGERSQLAGLLAPRHASPCRAVDPAADACLLLTSGTTDLPKSAALSHHSYLLPARAFGDWMEVTPEDRCLVCLPLFHLAGQSFAVSAIAAGAALAVVPRFSASNFWTQVRRHRISLVRHLGQMLALLCKQPAAAGDRDHSLRAVYGGGASPETAAEFERRFGSRVVEGYGLTETNTVLRNELRASRHGSIGRALPYCEVRIAGLAGEAPPAAATAAAPIGEIQVRRNLVMMRGYAGAPEATAAVFAGEWFKTGDLGWQDAEGWFYFVSRSKEVIRRRGENLVPAHIEKVLDSHPGVACSAVIGVADELGGEEAKAFVALRPGCRVLMEELVDWCRAALAEFEIPRFFELCDDLPRTATQKVHKASLRALGQAASWDRMAAGAEGAAPSAAVRSVPAG